MLSKVVTAVIVGVVTWIVVAFVGLLVGRYLDAQIGGFISNIAVLFGVIGAVWYYFTGRTLNV